MNKMKEVAKLLGVEERELFKIQMGMYKKPFKTYLYMITVDGLFYQYDENSESHHRSSCLQGLLTGYHTLIKIGDNR